jgi:transposase InsO family protein
VVEFVRAGEHRDEAPGGAGCHAGGGSHDRPPDRACSFRSRDQARLTLFRYIEAFHNPPRRHSSLEMLSPDEHESRYWQDHAAAAAA